jgi:RNA-directed DNA polymerase
MTPFMPSNLAWWRVIRWWMKLHRWKCKDVRRRLIDHTGRWRRPAAADGIEFFNIATVPITRYWYRGNKIPNPWILATTPNDRHRGEPVAKKSA